MMNMPKRQGVGIKQIFSNYCNPAAVDLLEKLLVFDPANRITVNDALRHAYLANLHDPEDEPLGKPVSAFDFDFEYFKLNTENYRTLIH